MSFKSFLNSGHKPTLLSAFLYSDMSFMVWVMLGPLAIFIGRDLNLETNALYTLVVIPLFAGALLRIPVGILVDHIGPKQTGTIIQLIVIVTLFFAYTGVLNSTIGMYFLAFALGLAGTSMAVALPLASRWYPDQYQGLALGVAGAASSGTVLAALFAPGLAQHYGWQNVMGIALLIMIVTLIVYQVYSKESEYKPEKPPVKNYLKILADPDVWWFMLMYGIAFGGVVALASILVLYFNQQYHVSPVTAGYFTAGCVVFGSILRPVGGWLADHWGGIRSLRILYTFIAFDFILVAFIGLPVLNMILIMIGIGALGMASGAVFQLVPLRFRREVGAATGMIGASGALGGFVLALALGQSKILTTSFEYGFILFAGSAFVCVFGIHRVKIRWRTTWGSGSATTAKV